MTNNPVAALLAKLELLYSNADAFLAFNTLSPAYQPADLAFVDANAVPGASPQDIARTQADFSRIANLIPKPQKAWTSDGSLLWTVYEDVLKQAALAQPAPTPADATQLVQAYTLLFNATQAITVAPDGTPVPLRDSQTYAAFRQYQRACQEAEERYNLARISATNSTDPAVRDRWQTVDEPKLKADLQTALDEWRTKGFKSAVEDALATIARLQERDPNQAWQDNIDALGKALSDLAGNPYQPTTLYPSSFIASNANWVALTLDAAEIASLAGQVSPELATLSQFVSDSVQQASGLEIESLSVELCRVDILRSWLNPDVFNNRSWRWSDTNRSLLSDGSTPPTGSLTAYAVGAIFARNLNIKLKPKSQANTQVIGELAVGKPILFGPFLLKKPKPVMIDGVAPQADFPSRLFAQDVPVRAIQKADFPELGVLMQKPDRPWLHSAVLDALRTDGAIIHAAPAHRFDVSRVSNATRATHAMRAPAPQSREWVGRLAADKDDRLAGAFLRRFTNADGVEMRPAFKPFLDPDLRPEKLEPAPEPTPAPAPAPEPAPEPEDDGMQLIAFVCRYLPKSPDPDPNLAWP